MQLLRSLAKCLTSIGPACLQILLGVTRNKVSLWRTLEPNRESYFGFGLWKNVGESSGDCLMCGMFDPQEIELLSFSVTYNVEELALKTGKVLHIGFLEPQFDQIQVPHTQASLRLPKSRYLYWASRW